MALNEGVWSETAFITINRYVAAGAADMQFAALTETIDIDMGDKDVEQVANLKGGRIIKKVPQDVTTITFEGYPVDADSVGGSGFSNMFQGGMTWDTTEPFAVNSQIIKDLYRVCILWTDDPAVTTATQVTAATSNGYRITFAHAWCTSMKPSYTDGILKVTLQFKCAAFNKNGAALIHEESSDGTAAIPVLASYNSTSYPPTGTVMTW